jgi:hypothetical protein
MIQIDGKFMILKPDSFYGGRNDRSVYQFLYRLPDSTWHLHTINAGFLQVTFTPIPEEQAIRWLIETRHLTTEAEKESPKRRLTRLVPQGLATGEDWSRWGRRSYSCPPPVGNQVIMEMPAESCLSQEIEERVTRILQPGPVLESIFWPPAAAIALTAGFRQERHDPMLARLEKMLESRLFERPRLSILQSLQDRGCDLLIEWRLRVRYGVQLKSNHDVEENGFATKTLAQVQDSRQHALERLFLVLAADITTNSNLQTVRAMVNRISSMNDPYVVVVPPERAWTLLLST